MQDQNPYAPPRAQVDDVIPLGAARATEALWPADASTTHSSFQLSEDDYIGLQKALKRRAAELTRNNPRLLLLNIVTLSLLGFVLIGYPFLFGHSGE
jgi:hypothetical protein